MVWSSNAGIVCWNYMKLGVDGSVVEEKFPTKTPQIEVTVIETTSKQEAVTV